MLKGERIVWPFPTQIIEPQTATTIVMTSELRVLLLQMVITPELAKKLELFPFLADGLPGRVFEPKQSLRLGAINQETTGVVLRGFFECYPLTAEDDDERIQRIWHELVQQCGEAVADEPYCPACKYPKRLCTCRDGGDPDAA